MTTLAHPLVEPPWLPVARAELGVKEVRGVEDCPRIVEYLSAVRHAVLHDETPWCSAFANWCMVRAGIEGTRNAAARSWLDWGVELDEPQRGCVTVLWRMSPKSSFGHVGFYCGQDKDTILLLGGNQANTVSIARYTKARVLSYRWPVYGLISKQPPPP